MLDSDLARLYEVETKRINEAVKNNPIKFSEKYCFRIDESEYQILKSKISTSSSNNYGGSRKGHNVFTEQGVSMLATVLKSEKAIKTSINIIDAFVDMKNYLLNNNNLLKFKYMNTMLIEHDNRLNILESFIPNVNTFSNQIFYDGQIYDAYSLLLDIFSTSKKSIIIIDNYISKELLDVLCKLKVILPYILRILIILY